jgi:adhesin/invasin
VAGQPSADKSSVSAAPGTIVASQGGSASIITVVVRDSRSNPIAGQAVTLAATGDGVSLSQPAATDASGTTTGSFSATGAGGHVISATVGGVTVGSTTVNVSADAPVVARATATVPAGVAGSATGIQVVLQDQFGNRVPGAAGQITITVSGSNPVGGLSVSDQGGGNYAASYTPTAVGVDLVDIRVAGQPIPGSPFTSPVTPGASDPNRTTAEVPDGAFAVPLEIVVHVADAQGNPVGHGGDVVTVTIANVGDLGVEDRGDGTYHAGWTPFTVGTFEVIITLNGTRIAGSYFTHINLFR